MALAKQILYAEDDSIDQLAFKRILSKDPRIHCTIARTVEEFFTCLQQIKVDLVVTDYYLPDGTAHDMLTLAKGIPSIVISGTIKPEEKEIIKEKGAIYYLGKPLIPGTFLPLIQNLLFGAPHAPKTPIVQPTPTLDVHQLKAISSKSPEAEIYLTEVILHEIPILLKQLELGWICQSRIVIKKGLDAILPKLQEMGCIELVDTALLLSQSIEQAEDVERLDGDFKRFTTQLGQVVRAASHILPQL